MKTSRFTEEKIIGVLREAAAGAKVPELCRRDGISGATYYNWKARYGGMDVTQLRRLKELEAFMVDALWNGRRFRTFNLLADLNREALRIEIDTSLPARQAEPERLHPALQPVLPRRGSRLLGVRNAEGGATNDRRLARPIQPPPTPRVPRQLVAKAVPHRKMCLSFYF